MKPASAAGVSLLALLAGADAALAQVTHTTSQSRTETVTVITNPTVRIDTFETRITGDLSNGTLLYDQTFPEVFTGATVHGGVSAATLAITNAGGPGIVITGPIRLEHTETLVDSQTMTNRTEIAGKIMKATGITVGPGSVLIGDRGLCTGPWIDADTGSGPTNCEGGVIHVLTFGDTNINTNTNTHYDVTETITNTEEWLTYEHWALTGIVQAVGVVHTAVQSGALDTGSGFLRRLGDQAAGFPATPGGVPIAYAPESRPQPRPFAPLGYGEEGTDDLVIGANPVTANPAGRGWAEAYGSTARVSTEGDVPGERRDAYGLAGGVGFAVAPGVSLGFGVDHGRTDITLDGAFAESGEIELTQFGLSARFEADRWFALAGVSYGIGRADTAHTPGGVSTASYDIATWGLLAETGYRFDLGPVRITPTLGLDHVEVRSDGFTETGGAALAAPAHATDRTRAWLGLDVGRRWDLASGTFDLSGYGRVVGVLSGRERLLPIAFTAAPDTPLAVAGNAEDEVGFDLGARAAFAFDNGAELFARYDGRFRDGFHAHQGTIGLKVTW